MSTDLTKMVEEARSKHLYNEKPPVSGFTLLRILTVVAAEIEGNTEALGHALKTCNNLSATCKVLSERIGLLREELPSGKG